jgi:hypothetical protein
MFLLGLFFVAALGIGLLSVKLLPITLYRAERYAITLFIGLFFASWLLLIGSWACGFTIAGNLTIGIGIVAGIAQYFLPAKIDKVFATNRQRWAWFITTTLFSFIVVYLLYTHMLGPGPDGYYSSSGSWGDLPLHLSIITNIAHIPSFHWDFSLFAGSKLTYPFIVDFLNGMMLRWTGNLPFSLLATSIPLCLCLVQILFFTFVRILKSVRAAAIAVSLFLLSGSSFGFVLLIWDFFHQHPMHLSFLWRLPVDYSNTSIFGYGNFFNSILLPQRSFQLGLPIFCLFVILISEAVYAKSRESLVRFIPAALLAGLLPLAHTHTFFVSAGILILALIYQLFKKHLTWIQAAFTLGVMFIFALPQLFFQLTANGHVSFLKYHLAWMFSDGTLQDVRLRPFAMIAYILANFGILFVLAVISYRKVKDPLLRAGFWIGIGIFIVANIFIFQPAEYDNIKFYIYGSFLLLPFVALLISTLSRSLKSAARFGGYLLFCIAAASGTAAVIFELPQHHLLYTFADFDHAQALRNALPPDKLVLTSDTHQHPLWGLAGQPVLRGYSYWLWSYGLPVQNVEGDIPRLYAGGQTALDLLEKYSIDYVYIGPSEREMYQADEAFFAHLFPVVLDEFDTRVYKVR